MIEFQNVTKYYGKKVGLKDVNFVIYDKDLVLFTGANGSGKSTSLKLILRFLKLQKKDSGKIINSFTKMSYIPEKLALPHFVKGSEFISDMLALRNEKKEYMKYFRYLDLDPKLPIFAYSKGMRQKLGIIQAIISDSPLVLLDEPLTGLDEESRGKVVSLIKEIRQEKTIIISTHYAEAFADLHPKRFQFENGSII